MGGRERETESREVQRVCPTHEKQTQRVNKAEKVPGMEAHRSSRFERARGPHVPGSSLSMGFTLLKTYLIFFIMQLRCK